jgi:phytoene synthase
MIDAAMSDVVRSTREPMLGPIRLAWWRERLEELEKSGAAPAEPRLQEVKRELIPRGVSGDDLAGLEAGWLRLFDPFPWGVEASEAIWLRGNLLFGLGGRLLGGADEEIRRSGGLWALVALRSGLAACALLRVCAPSRCWQLWRRATADVASRSSPREHPRAWQQCFGTG